MASELKPEVLDSLLRHKNTEESLELLASRFPGKVVFTTSFGIEDQVITHIIAINEIPVEIITLDTGRLFPQAYKVFSETVKKYNIPIKVFFPEQSSIEKMVSEKGPFSFYYSIENRIECCNIRKVIPLNRALKGKEVWISGIRAEQSDNRSKMGNIEYDARRNLFKFYPLFDWSYKQVKDFVNKNNIPYNILHDKGFVSIGCEPCTRAIKPGENFRSGRWWWESSNGKECGLHVK
ncbi:MAG: phosphoadenylyl-sulfate reductase [Bacteroidales bacterium]|jgi:phosphoadenosine phosphosulfate reductase|nr:phosphoadenylyl-sulfate reductase [Bacteroidales bacterium]